MTTLDTSKKTNKIKQFLKSFVYYALIFIVIYSIINWWRQPVMPTNPNLTFTTVHQETLDLQKLSEKKPILVYFWGTWCGVCRQTSPSVNHLALNSTYVVLGVAVNSGSNDEIKQYLTKKKFHFTAINDENGKIFEDWQGQVTPSFVILEKGKMVQGLTGIHPAWELKLRLWLIENF